jgi:hypothetical protein
MLLVENPDGSAVCERCDSPVEEHRVGDVCVEPSDTGPSGLPWELLAIRLAASQKAFRENGEHTLL